MLKIIFEGETLIIHSDQLEGHPGCEVLGECTPEDMADDIYAMVSPEHLRSVHLQKVLEAVLIVSGHDLSVGLLTEEAASVGMNLKTLAEQVLANREAERAFEIERRKRKVGGSNASTKSSKS